MDNKESEDDYVSSSESEESEEDIVEMDLPVVKYKDEIIETVRNNQVVIISGKTGCGKSTKIPQYLLEAGLNNSGIIGMTEPRRICAVNLAKRISKEHKSTLGREVGYQIRFDSKLNSMTKIKIMTEGVLLNEFKTDERLHDYGIIIIDEVHERSINCDIILGLLKEITQKRPDLRIIICSATINLKKISQYFNNAKVIKIKGRLYPVKVFYVGERPLTSFVRKLVADKEGDILIFVAGVSKVLKYCEDFKDFKNVVVFPLFAGIGIDAQKKALKPAGPNKTKIIVSTTVAESSITIEGIKIVIDTGYYKLRGYIPRLDIDTLSDVRVSKAQADQRRGRVGRTSPGTCYRLYDKNTYVNLREDFYPAIYKENLAEMYLKLIAINKNPFEFDYLDSPHEYMLRYAKQELIDLSLLNDDNKLTPLGKDVSDLPISPRLGKVIMTSIHKESFFDILCISALLTEEYIFLFLLKDEMNKAEERQKKFIDIDGDHFTLLNLYKEWKLQDNQRRWCYKYFINYPLMKEVDMIVEQISIILKRKGLTFCQGNELGKQEIKKSFIAVFYKNLSMTFLDDKILKIYDSQGFKISGRSHHQGDCLEILCLFMKGVKFGKKKFADQIITIEPDLLDEFKEEMDIINYEMFHEYESNIHVDLIMSWSSSEDD